MTGAGRRIAVGLVVLPAAVAGLAGCGKGSGQPAAAPKASANAASADQVMAAKLKGALLTRVNGVAVAAPASIGSYASVTQAVAGKQASGAAQVTPKSCAGSVTKGFTPTALTDAPAAAETFRVGTNGVSEVLIASSGKTASAVLDGSVPAGCARFEEKTGGKTYTYTAKEQAVTGVGVQAKVLSVRESGGTSNDLWSLIYRGSRFVGTVTVVGPNASESAVQELGKQAYAFAAKTLS